MTFPGADHISGKSIISFNSQYGRLDLTIPLHIHISKSNIILNKMKIVKGVYRLPEVRGSNVYLLESDKELLLIDTGLKNQADEIFSQIRELGFKASDLKSIALTHAHPDHIGSAAELKERTSARILSHIQEIPFIEKREILPSGSWLSAFFNWLDRKVLPGGSGVSVDKGLEDSDTLDVLGGLQVIHTPGHTPGAMCLYHPERKLLFCGDTLFNQNPATGRKGLRPPIALFTADKEQAWESIRRLSGFEINAVFFGHGDPILERASEQIKCLLEER